MEKKVIVKKDKVIIMVKSQFVDQVETEIFTERYAILLRTRWSLLYFFFKEYAIENGQRGCYVGEKRGNDGLYYDIWDLTKIFPNVLFKTNTY